MPRLSVHASPYTCISRLAGYSQICICKVCTRCRLDRFCFRRTRHMLLTPSCALQISLHNPYLSSRLDMSIMDSQPWHQAYTAHLQQEASSSQKHTGSGRTPSSTPSPTKASSSMHSIHKSADSKNLSGYEASQWALQHGLETRHPLAVGHLINHPPPGKT